MNDESISPATDFDLPSSTLPSEHERTQSGEGGEGGKRVCYSHSGKPIHSTVYQTGENATLDYALHNDADAKAPRQKETPIHRRMVDLHLQGFNITEIAKLLGHTNSTVSNTLRQPWARQYMINTSRQDVMGEVQKLLKDEVLPSLNVLIEIRDNDTLHPAVRAGAANSLIERLLGKAAQPIISTKTNDLDKLSDAELHAIARGN